MRALVGRTLRWFLDAAPPKDGKSRAEVNAELRALSDAPWCCPAIAEIDRLRSEIVDAYEPNLRWSDHVRRMRALDPPISREGSRAP